MKRDVLGIAFVDFTLEEAVAWALETMQGKTGAYVCTPNPEMVWATRKNRDLQKAIARADAVLPDGVGIVWASRQLRTPLPERVAGFDFLLALLERMEGSVFLLGGRPGVGERAAENLRKRFPRVTVSGFRDGYFEDDASIVESVCQAEPDLLLVCLGSPKQELWMAKWAGALPVGLMAGLGGCLDILAGRTKRAPESWIRWKLEWLYRLLQEPRRIKRQLRLPLFVAAVLAERIKR